MSIAPVAPSGCPSGDCPAVDVHALGVEVEFAHRLHDDRGEGLVDLPQVDVAGLHARHAQRLLAGRRGAGEHEDRVAAHGGHRADSSARLERVLPDVRLRRENHDGGAIGEPARVSCGVKVADLLFLRKRGKRNLV